LRTAIAIVAGILMLGTATAFAEDMIGADTTAPPAPDEENTPAVLSGTLQKVRETGVVTIGYRDS
jgi:glutamate/aspartate transport system substrate-binding protein